MERTGVKVYIVRHAESEYNLAQRKAKGKEEEVLEDEEDLSVTFDEKLIDSPLSAEGFSQAEACANELLNIDFDIILTSPLLRCLQTTDPIYQKLSKKPRVIVEPTLRERVTSSCDLPVDTLPLKEKFQYMDFSFLERSKAQGFWIKEELEKNDEENSKRWLAEIENTLKLNELMKKIHPETIESQKALNDRTQNFRKQLLEDRGFADKKILIVSHSAFLESFTATKYWKDDTPLDGNYLKNAEFAEVTL